MRTTPPRIRPLACLILGALGLLCGAARADSARLIAAFQANDLATLQRLSVAAANPQQRQLAAGAVRALRRQDAAARSTLTAVTRSRARRDVRAAADLALAGIDLRDGRYRACALAIRAASRLAPGLVHAGDRQTLVFAQALAGVPPMRLLQPARGTLAITPDRAGLSRVPVVIDGHAQDALLDTGAQFSTLSASAARRAGIRMLSQPVTVGSSTEQSVATRLGIASRLRIGRAVLANVVFIVLPDAALSFAHGAYTIDAIVGLPVFLALGRIGFVNGASPAFVYGRARGRTTGAAGNAKLLLSGLEPLVLTHVLGMVRPLRLKLDTGANATLLDHAALRDAPRLLAHAEGRALRLGGAGGDATDRKALRLPSLTLVISGRHIKLGNVAVTSGGGQSSDGTLGQDVLRQAGRLTLDFHAMTVSMSR